MYHGETLETDSLNKIKPENSVVASPSAALFLLHTKKIMRYDTEQGSLEPFDYIVVQPHEATKIHSSYLLKVNICKVSSSWIIYCHH
ncbi:MAG: hypothetical protein OXT67_09985, partial [Zetaproteobacteria bacterium]|nr:hypothetical protein [Zetaproteobacteria bacterium]